MSDLVVDSHVHVVSPERDDYPLSPVALPNGAWYDDHPLAIDDLIASMDVAGVDHAVLVQANGAYGVDNNYAADAARLAGDRCVGVSIVDLEAPDRIERLRYWTLERGMQGTRLFDIPPSEPSWLDDPATAEVVAAAVELDLALSVCILEPQLPRLAALLERLDGRRIVLDHCGFADFRGGPQYPSAEPLRALARYPNLHLKVTPTVFELGLDPGGDPGHLLAHLVSVFGADRLMWGSDFPQHHVLAYPAQTDWARTLCSGLSDDDRRAVLGGTAAEFWFAA